MTTAFYTSIRGHDVLVTVDMDRAAEHDQRQHVTVEMVRGQRRRKLRVNHDVETWAITEAHSFMKEAA